MIEFFVVYTLVILLVFTSVSLTLAASFMARDWLNAFLIPSLPAFRLIFIMLGKFLQLLLFIGEYIVASTLDLLRKLNKKTKR